jgi:hypothetical protein
LGLLDDLILVPAGVWLVLRLLRPELLAELRAEAARRGKLPVSRAGAAAIVLLWIATAGAIFWWLLGTAW